MRKSVKYIIVGIGATAVAVAAVLLFAFYMLQPQPEDILALYQDDAKYGSLTIRYPLDGTLFPPEIVPPTFHWKDENPSSNLWLVTIRFQDNNASMNFLTHEPKWTPQQEQWEVIKRRSLEKDAEVTILGVNSRISAEILSAGRITIRTSKDEVGAPLFYREVNLPFIDAVKDPSHIRWRFGSISLPRQPPIVLQNLPVCGNCHSFSTDGQTLGMDVDYANDKGSYVITQVAEQMVLASNTIITWSDYKREDKEQTFGLLSQVCPDGKVVISTVKDKSVFVPKPDLAFSQLFFPFKGILAIYNRETDSFQALPGADDPQFVQSNPTWSPDGKYIVFARAKAYDLKSPEAKGKVLLSPEDCKEFLEEGKPFPFDLYRIPFNDGKGGKPEPIEGASNNGMSNYFAKYSPDGKWIVFCKAKSYMLLQPDSELYIIPAEGGKARRLRANTSRMNSWHSWSPNGKWLVFSSKANSDYTQLFITHIDEQGRSSPSVLLEHFTAPDRAANIPEFVNAKPMAIKNIQEQFLDDYSFVRAAIALLKADDFDGAEVQYRKALELNPKNVKAHTDLGYILLIRGMYKEGMVHVSEAIKLDPNNADAYSNLGLAMLHERKADEAIRYLSKAVKLKPNVAETHLNLGAALALQGKFDEALEHYSMAVEIKPEYAEAHYNLGEALSNQGKFDEAVRHYSKAVGLKPGVAEMHYNLGVALSRQGKPDEAIKSWLKAVQLKPDYAEAHYNLGVVLDNQKKFDEATKHYSMAIRIKPDYPEAHYNLGVVLARQGKSDEAVRHWSKAVQLKPSFVEAYLNLGATLARQGKLNEAITHWLEAVRLNPNNISALINLAAGYAKTGQFQEAALTAQKALNLARAAGEETLAEQIQRRIQLYRQNKSLENSSIKKNDK